MAKENQDPIAGNDRLRFVALPGSIDVIAGKAGKEWVRALIAADTQAIAEIVSDLHNTPKLVAMRDAARIVIDDRLNARTIRHMRRLECVGVLVGVVGIVVAGIGIFAG